MTNTALKAQIDSQITNETTQNGITPAEVGGNIKAVVDYVDQENKVKVVKTTISSSQILSLFSTPITVLNAFTTNFKYPINIYIKVNTTTAFTLADNTFNVIDDGGNVLTGDLNMQGLTFNANIGFSQSTLGINFTQNSDDRNYSYKLKAKTGNPTLGVGSIDVYVTYVETTL